MAPLFHPVGGAGLRLSDYATYLQIVQTYSFGTPIIFGVAPDTLSATYSAPIYTVDTGINSTTPGLVQVSFPYTNPTVVGHTPTGAIVFEREVSRSVGGGTLVGVNWTDSNGIFYADVEWNWAVDVNLYTNIAPVTGKWEQQVITYTGNGVDDRLVPTSFPLNSGTVLVWVFPDTAFQSTYRHTGMTGSGQIVTPADGTFGIMTLGAAGFTVKDNIPNNCHVNTNLDNYTAIVLRDSTSDNRYLHVGEYTGTAIAHSETSGGTNTVTQVWLIGLNGNPSYGEERFTPPNSVCFTNAASSITNLITALGTGSFSVGTDNIVNKSGTRYYYAAFSIPTSDAVRQIFQTYKITGTGSVIQVTGLGFTPAFATARGLTTLANESVWRSPWETGTTSVRWDMVGSPSGGIRAFGSGTIDIGTVTAPSGRDVFGFALPSSGSVSLPPDYVLTNVYIDGISLGASTTFGLANASRSTGFPDTPLTVPGIPPTNPSSGSPANPSAGGGSATALYWGLQRFDVKTRPEETA